MMDDDATLAGAVDAVPAGAYAVAVSGGADSVALLYLLRRRTDLRLHIVHLDHETRGQASSGDAAFVAELARKLGLACTVERRSAVEASMDHLPANRSARFRAVRLVLFARIVRQQHLAGIIMGHHADDQAETVFQRLVRGSGPGGLSGMRVRARIADLTIYRPLLNVRRQALRDLLMRNGWSWREDASNTSDRYQRNRVRALLATHPPLTDAVLALARVMARLNQWAGSAAPPLAATFDVAALRDVPEIVAQVAARRWLRRRGCPAGQLTAEVAGRLIVMANDAATPARQHFPGGVLVRRRQGRIST